MNLLTNEFYFTASDATPWRDMSLSRLVTLIIDTATLHANELGVGFARLKENNSSWVLSRLAVDLPGGFPMVNRPYRLLTWVTSLNRMFSERLFELVDDTDGTTIGWAHTTWMAIDLDTRRPADLSVLTELSDVINPRPFGGEKPGKLIPLKGEMELCQNYTFRVSDIDINRHVTTRRYVDMITDLWPLDHYMTSRVVRFEIAFKHEARYGDTATTSAVCDSDGAWLMETSVDGTVCNLAKIQFTNR